MSIESPLPPENFQLGTIAYSVAHKRADATRSVVTRLFARPEFTITASVAAGLLYKFKIMCPAARGPRLFLAMIHHDAAIFALMLLFYSVGSAITRRNNRTGAPRALMTVLAKTCLLVFLLVLFLYAADVFVYHFFVTRLYASDIVTFSSETGAAFSLLRTGWRVITDIPAWKPVLGAVLVLFLLRACYQLLFRSVQPPVHGRLLLLGALFLLVLSQVPVPGYVYSFHDRALYQNFVERNESFFAHTNFSDPFRDHLLATPSVENCMPGRGRQLDVVLLMVESLSAYDSHYFSGIEDWTPRLDEIARRETALPNFYANGWVTIGGLISLLGGAFPLVPEHTAFNPHGTPRLLDFIDLPRPLARILAQQGYATEFIAAGDTTFIGQERWLRAMGFEQIVGPDDPRFAQQKVRGPFNSVPDRLLLDVAFQELSRLPADRPHFMVVQTFWSHRPFIDQNGGHVDGEEPVRRESDAQVGAFYGRLAAAGFLEKGLLFITGDHRAPESFRKAEFDRFGASAAARIPAVIATHAVSLPRVLAQDFQQRDFGPSIEALVSDRYCLGPQEGAFLSDPPMPSSCILHARGDDRDLIFVKCGTQEGTVRVAGDATRFISGGVPDEPSIISTINRTRVRPVN